MLPETAELMQEDMYFDISDEELAKRAKNGDSFACDYLVRRYKDFVRVRTKSFYLIGAEREDVVQEGMIGLYKAIQNFEPEKRVTFKTFAELCITRHIITAVKASMRKKHIPLNNYVSLNKQDSGSEYFENCRTDNGHLQDPEQLIIDEESIRDVESCMGELLSRFETQVLVYHLNGIGYSKIADLIGKDAKSVDNALQRIKRKLEKYLRERK